MNGIYDNDFKKFFKYAKEIKEIPPIPKNFNTKHLQDFINEFESVKQENERLKDKIKAYYVSNDIDEVLNYIDNLEQENTRLKEMFIQNEVKQKMLLEDINKYAIGVIDNYLKEN